MRNKTILATVFFALILVLIGAGCPTTPEQNVDRLEKEKTERLESSGYNECMARIDAQTAEFNKCVSDKVIAKGYTDGLDCIMNYDNPICKDTTRYNAQSDSNNECIKELDNPTDLTMADCLKLLNAE